MTPEERAKHIWESTDLDCEHNRMTVEQLADEIRVAVAKEREACAKLAESWVDPDHKEWRPLAVGCEAAFNEGLECSAVKGIAAVIRARAEK